MFKRFNSKGIYYIYLISSALVVVAAFNLLSSVSIQTMIWYPNSGNFSFELLFSFLFGFSYSLVSLLILLYIKKRSYKELDVKSDKKEVYFMTGLILLLLSLPMILVTIYSSLTFIVILIVDIEQIFGGDFSRHHNISIIIAFIQNAIAVCKVVIALILIKKSTYFMSTKQESEEKVII
jgi:Zn-dependent protease with chaperone function